jgi:pimeloyl-ACP methyl ester carboxylesterase
MKKNLTAVFLILISAMHIRAFTQTLAYPYKVNYIQLEIEQQSVKMAYMDVASPKPNNQTVLLFHGKNFNGYYWKGVIAFLNNNGYRVIVPDQVGWGLSDKPNIHYSFHLLASNTRKLLDSLGIKKVHLIGHSMGGMVATRFVLMYPEVVEKLIYENPIGLEDYRTFVPWQSTDDVYKNELKATYESVRKYQQTYFPKWNQEYEQYALSQYEALQYPDFKEAAWSSALTYQMIYEQPVVYEFRYIKKPTLIVIGLEDRTVIGKNLLQPDVAAKHGQYPILGKWLKQQIKKADLVELKGVGHIAHIQVEDTFNNQVLMFLKKQ